MEYILEVKDLSVTYEQRTGFGERKDNEPTCKHISFTIQEGEILGLIGESGCGKSTLARAILGMEKNYTGEIIHAKKGAQMVFQDTYASLNPAKRIQWILEEPLRVQGQISKDKRREKVMEMIEKVELPQDILTRYPHQLSGGQRQRVGIAVALMQDSKLLIADEPVSALDVTIQSHILQLLFKLHKEMGLAMLFISHDLRLVYQLCSRVIIMKEGRIIESGITDQVYFNPQNEYTKSLLKIADIRGAS